MIAIKAVNGYGGITKLSGKRRRPYWVRITTGWDVTPTGKAKQIYKTLGYYATRKEATLALAAYNTNPTDLTRKDITFSQVFDIWSTKHFEKYPSSEASLMPVFNKYCASLHDMAMVDIRAVHLQKVMDAASHLSASTHHKIKAIMGNSFKYCLENDIVQKDYSQFVKITAEPAAKAENFFTRAELDKVLAAGPDDITLMLLHTGMRIGELLSIKLADIELEARYIRVHGTKTKNANRIVPIHRDMVPIIERNMSASTGEHLFTNSAGGKVDYSSYTKKHFKPFMASLGLHQTPHATRHTFISLMDSAGVSSNSVTLKRIVGHSNSSVTHHYTHKEIAELIEAIDKLKLL